MGSMKKTIILKFNGTTGEIFFIALGKKKKKEVVREEEALNIDMLEYCHNLQS